jgi:hypothetical protein
MSAGAAGLLAPAPARMPSRTARPQLRLVASHGELSPDALVDAYAMVDAFELAGLAPRPAIRLTRRGRLVITLMATVAVAILAVALAGSVDAAAPQIDHATTVMAGQTLSEVAATQLPSLPIRDAVARIQLVNGLNTSQVQADQSLLIPAMP